MGMEMIFCAEIGSCHKGIPALAYEYIRQASLAGADIAKFQLGHRYDDEMRSMPNRYAQELKSWCDYWDIEFMASILSFDGLGIARRIGQKRYKMAARKPFAGASRENYDELFAAMMSDDKEIFVSDGNVPDAHNVHKIWCVSEYPTYPEDVIIPNEFTYWWGYSSHVHGIADALIAIARGACYVEKHVTLDKTEESIKDNHFALSFEEFAQMVRLGKDIARFS